MRVSAKLVGSPPNHLGLFRVVPEGEFFSATAPHEDRLLGGLYELEVDYATRAAEVVGFPAEVLAKLREPARGDSLAILDRICVSLPCPRCGDRYEVPLRNLRAAEQQIHEGCPVAMPEECPQSFWTGLSDEETLKAFERAWAKLESRVQLAGGRLVVCGQARR